MRHKFGKCSIAVAAIALASAVTLGGCGKDYTTKLTGDISGAVVSNGGFVVEKGNYVYFINGAESYTASNAYGKVDKGSLMRISKADLQSGAYDKAETVVPMLFVSGDTTAGIYIYGDYVYYASPTTEKDSSTGKVMNDWISFKRSKLDGTDSMAKGYLSRLENRSAEYRFVQPEENGTVYCLYVDDSNLYSLNTTTKKTVTLVKGASNYYFNDTDLEDPNVYYTMSVTERVDTDTSDPADYNQIYTVRADATATVNASEASYTTSTGTTYDFDETYLKKNLDGFKASDYTTYPYVNLGTLVLDGVGFSTGYTDYRYTTDKESITSSSSQMGYTYTIQGYRSSGDFTGLYFTKKEGSDTESDGSASKLYYLDSTVSGAEAWNTITGNDSADVDVVALNDSNASADAVYLVEQNGAKRKHTYLYYHSDDTTIYKVVDGGDPIPVAPSVSSATLWKTEGNYLYYYATGSDGFSGNNLSRVDYTGGKEDYSVFGSTATSEDFGEYAAQQILEMDWKSDWYMPELLGTKLFYCNAQDYDGTSLNYVYVIDLANEHGELMTATELKAYNEKYAEVTDYIEGFSSDYPDLQNALTYVFRANVGETDENYLAVARKEAEELGYKEHYLYRASELEKFDAFLANKDKDGKEFKDENGKSYARMSYYTNLLGKMKSSDTETMEDAFKAMIRTAPEPDEDEGLSTKQKVWIGVGIGAGVLAVAAVVIVICVAARKKAKRKAEIESTKVRKPAIDVKDDKSIDVYADDEPQETVEETQETVEAAEATTETVEAAEEETAAEETDEETPVAVETEEKTE